MAIRKTIRTPADALAYLADVGISLDSLETVERDGKTYVCESAACTKCGGTGYGPWQPDGGRCYSCGGTDTRGRVVRRSLVRFAQQEKRRRAAQRRREADREARAEAQLERQREWCESNGHGRITFAELDDRRAAHREAQRRADAEASDWIGSVGERIEIRATIEAIPTWQTAYGRTYCYLLRCGDNRVVWYASSQMVVSQDSGSRAAEVGDVVALRCTVKAHDVRDDVRQTVVTRAKATSLVIPAPAR